MIASALTATLLAWSNAGGIPSDTLGFPPEHPPQVSPAGSPIGSPVEDGWWLRLSPPCNRGAASAFDPIRRRIVSFGGFDGLLENDLWVFDLPSGPWRRLEPEGNRPAPRQMATMMYDAPRDRMIVFGGELASGDASDLWALSMSQPPAWTQPTTQGRSPAPREGHSAVYDPAGDRMLLFGGYNEWTGRTLNDTWTFSLGSAAWDSVAPSGAAPLAREGHGAIFDVRRRAMVIFGGHRPDGRSYLGDVYLDDVWSLSVGALPAWTRDSSSSTPSERAFQACAYDSAADRMLMFGGYDYDDYYYPPTETYYDEAWAMDLSTFGWTQLGIGYAAPPGRRNYVAVFDDVARRFVAAMGEGPFPFGLLADTWSLDASGGGWTALVPPVPQPNPDEQYRFAVFDDARRRTWLVQIVLVRAFLQNRLETRVWYRGAADAFWTFVPGASGYPSYVEAGFYDPARDRIVAYAQQNGAGLRTSDVEVLELSPVPSWHGLSAAGPPPPPRGGPSFVYDPGRRRALLVAGLTGQSYVDVWAMTLDDTPTWTPLVPNGPAPGMVASVPVLYDALRDRMLLMGYGLGRGMWAFDLSAPQWTRIDTLGGQPSDRGNEAGAYDAARDRVIIACGNGGEGPWNGDVWALDLSGTPTWTALAPQGEPLTDRSNPAYAWDPLAQTLRLFGGANHLGQYADTWALTFDRAVPIALSEVAVEAHSDRVTLTWTSSLAGPFEVARRAATEPWRTIATVMPDGQGVARIDDHAVVPRATYGYRISAGGRAQRELMVRVPDAIAMLQLVANPSGGRITVRYAAANPGMPVELGLLDLSGRLIERRAAGASGLLSFSRSVPPGVYLVRLKAGNTQLTRRAVVLQ
jgi:galactose oxidase-like protein